MKYTKTEPVTFAAKFGISQKLIKVKEFDDVKSAFINHPHFPQQFTVQFAHKDVEEYIDLDSSIQLLEQFNNNLFKDPSTKNDDRDKENDGDSSDISK